jgi:nitrous oxidase accessory protein
VLAVAVLGAVVIAPGTAADDPIDLQPLIDAAEPGSTVTLEPGLYRGNVVIDKPLTLIGRDWPVIDAAGTGNVIEVTAPDVTIEGVVLLSTGDSLDQENAGVSSNSAPRIVVRGNRFEDVLFGTFLRKSPDSVIADNDVGAKDLDLGRRGDGIRIWESPRTLIEGNTVIGGRDSVFWFSDGVIVRNNTVKDGRYGLHFMYSDGAVVEGNELVGNSVGSFLMYSAGLELRNNIMAENFGPSGYGVGLKDMDGVHATGNRFIGNRVGMYLDNTPWSYDKHQTVSGNLFAYNKIGVLFQPSVERNHFTENAFIDNGEQVGITQSGTFEGNEWEAAGVGNYWSDFAGYDADGDGIGDVPYRLEELYSTLTDNHPDLVFFNETPAARAVDLAARMFPVLRPRPKVEDAHPLTVQPELPPIAGMGADSTSPSLLVVSVLLVLGAVSIIAVPMRRQRRRHRSLRTAS